jgi:hypothetical protein
LTSLWPNDLPKGWAFPLIWRQREPALKNLIRFHRCGRWIADGVIPDELEAMLKDRPDVEGHPGRSGNGALVVARHR